jgi:c-di-GMP-binding flagellar brake protein YcgR
MAASVRRRSVRVEVSEGVHALWNCAGREDLSRVRDLSLGGLFIESPVEVNLGAVVKLNFLADEGQIRASAEVRHTKPGQGLGLRFIAIHGQDWQHLATLIKRLGSRRRSAGRAQLSSHSGQLGAG